MTGYKGSAWTYRGFKVRWRTVTSRTATGPYRGPEVQVLGDKGRVLARFDIASQAETWIDRKLDA